VAETNPPAKLRTLRYASALGAMYVGALVLGYVLGARGLLPYGPLRASTSTPLARVGMALKREHLPTDAVTSAALREDIATVRAGLSSPEREVFELVTAVRGLNNGGNLDVPAAQQSCRALEWPRCDDPALEALRKRSRP
jgi:hypothetical protein